MAQDSDVARVAAALKAPGLRYRSFGNEPVRAPRVDVSTVNDAYPLLGAAMESAADDMAAPELTAAEPEPMPAPEPVQAELPPISAYVPPPEPVHAAPPEPVYVAPPAPVYVAPPAPVYAPPPAQQPAPMPEPAPAPSLFAQALSQPPAAPPAVQAPAQTFAPAPTPAPAAPAYSLLEALGRQSDLGPSMSASASLPAAASYGQPAAGPAPGGTFGSLLAGSAGSPGFSAPGAAPAAWSSGGALARSASLLPAAAVTIPLSEVMRLIAVGAPAPSSSFDAFRAAVRAPGSR